MVHENIRTPNSDFTWFIDSSNSADLWFILLPLIHSRVIFIALGSVWDLPHTAWEREIIEAIKSTTMGHWWVWNIYFVHWLVSWTTSSPPNHPYRPPPPWTFQPAFIDPSGWERWSEHGAWIDILLGPGVYPAEVNFDFSVCCGITSFSPTGREQWE